MIQEFLNAYKNLEAAVRLINSEASVFDYENSLTDPLIQEKLKVCRIQRNYIQHNIGGDTFLNVTTHQLDFLNSVTNSILTQFSSAGDLANKTKAIRLTDTLLQASRKFANQDELPLLDKTILIGSLTAQEVVQLIGKAKSLEKTIGEVLKNPSKENYITIQDTDYNALLSQDKHNYVVDNKGKYIGEILYKVGKEVKNG